MWSVDWAAALATRLIPRLVRSDRALAPASSRGEMVNEYEERGTYPEALPSNDVFPAGRSEHESDATVVPVQLGADQLAVAEAQLLEVAVDRLEVLVVELTLQRAKEVLMPVGSEPLGVVIGDLAQLLEPYDGRFELVDRARQDGRGYWELYPQMPRLSSSAPTATAYISRTISGSAIQSARTR